MASTTSDVGYPFRAIHDWSNPTGNPQATPIRRGVEGKVIGENDKGWRYVTFGRTGRTGWVPVKAIEVGKERKFGDIKLVHELPPNISTPLAAAAIAQARQRPSLLAATLDALMLGLRDRRGDIPDLKADYISVLESNTQRTTTMDTIIQGLVPSFVQIVGNNNSTVGDLLNNLPRVQIRDKEAGIYIRVTSDFVGEPQRRPELYVGQTIGFWKRFVYHKSPKPSDGGVSAASVRAAKSICMLKVCVLTEDPLVLTFAEQLITLVVATYQKKVTQLDVEEASTPADAENVVVKHLPVKLAGTLLTRVAKSVFGQLDFQPLCERARFNAPVGLNWDSPLYDVTRARTQWVRTVQPGVMEAYHRGGLDAYMEGKTMQVTPFNGRSYDDAAHNFKVNCYPGEPRPEKDSILFVVCEIMTNGQAHHTPWARLPAVGPWSDWEYANRFGVRIEWQENDKWYQRYCQSSNTRQFQSGDPGAFMNYAIATGALRYFQGVGLNNPRGWDINYGTTRIKDLVLDHFTQTLTVKHLVRQTRNMQRPTLKSMDAVGNELRQLGAQNIGQWGIVQGIRTSCDGCRVANMFDVSTSCAIILCVLTSERARQGGTLFRTTTHVCESGWTMVPG